MRSFLTKTTTTTKLLVDDDVFLSSSLSSLPRSFCAALLLLLSMLTLMPSSAATARTTTGCSFAVVCVSVYQCVFILFVCVEPSLFLGRGNPKCRRVAETNVFFEFSSKVARCAFSCFLEQKKRSQKRRRCWGCDNEFEIQHSSSSLLHTVRYISLLKTHTHYIYIHTNRGCRRCL